MIDKLLAKFERLIPEKLISSIIDNHNNLSEDMIDRVDLFIKEKGFPDINLLKKISKQDEELMNYIDKEIYNIQDQSLKERLESMTNKLKDKKGKLIRNTLFLVTFLALITIIIKRNNCKNNSTSDSPDLDIKENDIKLSNEDKDKIKNYFLDLEKYLNGFFLRKYYLSFFSLKSSDIEELKNKYPEEASDKVSFPLKYSQIKDNEELVNFIKEEYSNYIFGSEDSDSVLNLVKESFKKKSHEKILNEIKKYISEDSKEDLEEWENIYNSEPVSIVN